MKRLIDLIQNIITRFNRLGTILDDAQQASTTSGSWSHKGSITLTEGAWLVFVTVVFDANATGNRLFVMNNSSSSTTSAGYSYADRRIAAGGSAVQTYLKTQFARDIAKGSSETWYIHGYQNSGSSLNMNTRIQAVKVR